MSLPAAGGTFGNPIDVPIPETVAIAPSHGLTGMYGPPLCRKRKMKVTEWSAQMYPAFVGSQSSWP
jgi:hypothetical protein